MGTPRKLIMVVAEMCRVTQQPINLQCTSNQSRGTATLINSRKNVHTATCCVHLQMQNAYAITRLYRFRSVCTDLVLTELLSYFSLSYIIIMFLSANSKAKTARQILRKIY